MSKIRLLPVLAFLLICFGLPTYGGSWDWVVAKVSGKVAISTKGVAALSLEPASVLKRGDVVRTGANGRVRLVRNDESVFIGPNTIASIATRPTPGMRTTILMQSGTSEFEVHKRSKVHFSVETPYLVAVVKGTKFKVSSGSSTSRVSVREGRVEVRSLKTGQYADIVAGQTATVNSKGGLELSGAGAKSPIWQGAPRAPMAIGLALNTTDGNVGVGTGVSLGQTNVAVDAGVNLGSGLSGAGVSAAVNSNVAGGVTAGVSAGVSSGGVSAGLGVGLGGLGLGGLNVGLGLGGGGRGGH